MKKKTKHLALFGLVLIGLVLCLGIAAGVIQAPAASLGGLAFLPFAIGSLKVRESMDDVKTVMYVNSNATTKDTVYLINSIPMLAINSALENATNVYLLLGVIEYAKVNPQAWTGGVKVYWDDTAKNFTTASTGNTLAGVAFEPAASTADTGLIYLCPFLVGTNELENTIADPGNAVKAIPVTKSGVCPIVTAGAETRTLAAPSVLGQMLEICMKTDGGDCVITCATTVNQAGNNTVTLNDAGDAVTLVAKQNGADLRWSVLANDGASLSTV